MEDVGAGGIWQAILGELQLQVSKPIYETWLNDTQGSSISDSVLRVTVPTSFAIEWLERRMYQAIQTTASKVAGRSLEVEFQVRIGIPQETLGASSSMGDLLPPIRAVRAQPPNLNDKYDFSSFVVGPSNRLPYSAAQAVADAPGQSYNPLFMYSGAGLGKTHLLHAIGHRCVSRGLSCIYVTSEQFTNEFINAIRARTTEEFRARYRSVQVLLIDDIQFISGKEQTQEGFFHTFNDLHNSNRQLVLTSDRPPNALSPLEERLRSRFEWGLIADIQPPDFETRIAILRNKARQMKVELEDNIIEYLALKVRRNVRELEGSLNRVAALARLPDSPITLELASAAITNFVHDMSSSRLEPDRVLDEVTGVFKVTTSDLVGASRRKRIVRARHVAMYLLSEELGMKDTEIGRLLGGRSHSTVISALRKMNSEIDSDDELRKEVLSIKEAMFS